MSKIGLLRQFNAILSRSKLASLVGQTYGGNRDMYDILGYKKNLIFDDYFQRYNRHGIAARVVDAYPEETWKRPPNLLVDGKKDTNMAKNFEKLARRVNLYAELDRADKVSGIGQYGVIFLGLRDGKGLDEPATRVSGPDDLLYMSTFHEDDAEVVKVVTDARDPRFGLPELYKLSFSQNLTNPQDTAATMARPVHWSRVIHIAEGALADKVFGIPRMRPVWNYLDDLDKLSGGTGEAIWRTGDRGIHVNVEQEADLNDEDEAALQTSIDNYINNLERFIYTQGADVQVLSGNVINPSGAFVMIAALIAGSTGIPSRVLFGSESGKLASTQDERNWLARVESRRARHADPHILTPLVNKWIELGILTGTQGEITFDWPNLFTLSEQEQADLAARMAQAIKNVSTQNPKVLVIDPDDFRRMFITRDKEDMEDLTPTPTEPEEPEPQEPFEDTPTVARGFFPK